jgi:hypothetical protein
LSFDEQLEIERGLTAEFATSKVLLPHSKKPLVIHSDGTYDKSAWDRAAQDNGPAARLGDQIQITRVQIESNKILLEIIVQILICRIPPVSRDRTVIATPTQVIAAADVSGSQRVISGPSPPNLVMNWRA